MIIEQLKQLVVSWKEKAESTRPRAWAYEDGLESDAYNRCAEELEEALTQLNKETVYSVYGSNRHSGDESSRHLGYFIGTPENIKLWVRNDKFCNQFHPENGGELDIYEFDIYKRARRV